MCDMCRNRRHAGYAWVAFKAQSPHAVQQALKLNATIFADRRIYVQRFNASSSSPYSSSPASSTPHDTARATHTRQPSQDCRHWLRYGCARPHNCTFLHDPNKQGTALHSQPRSHTTPSPSRQSLHTPPRAHLATGASASPTRGTATHCNALQHTHGTATHRNALQHTHGTASHTGTAISSSTSGSRERASSDKKGEASSRHVAQATH